MKYDTYYEILTNWMTDTINNTKMEIVDTWTDDHQLCFSFTFGDGVGEMWWVHPYDFSHFVYFNECENAKERVFDTIFEMLTDKGLLGDISCEDGLGFENELNLLKIIGFRLEDIKRIELE